MYSSADVVPILTVASRAERAAVRADRRLAHRKSAPTKRAHLDANDDGLAVTPAELKAFSTVHRTPCPHFDWAHLAAEELVPLPQRTREREKAARREAASRPPRREGERSSSSESRGSRPSGAPTGGASGRTNATSNGHSASTSAGSAGGANKRRRRRGGRGRGPRTGNGEPGRNSA